MIVPDANLILYAHNSADPDYKAARRWWEGLLASDTPVSLSIVVLLAFLRLSTSRKVLRAPLSVEEAAERVEAWFTSPSVHLIGPARDHLSILLALIRKTGSSGNLTTDAHIAALALEHNAEIHSSDLDFGRFPGVRWVNPLAASK